MPLEPVPLSEQVSIIDAAEAARRLKICRHTIYDLIADGRLPAVRYPGHSWQINPEDLDYRKARAVLKDAAKVHKGR